MKPNIIYIQIVGPIGVGKTGLISIIKSDLESRGFSCVSPNLRKQIRTGAIGIVGRQALVVPERSGTVIVLCEDVEKVNPTKEG